jgi:predicted small lipoprotein YifL
MRPFLLILVLSILGCGQRGPLYLPDQGPGEAVNEPATSAEAAAAGTGPAEPVSPDGREGEEDRDGKRTDEDVPADR